MDDRLREPIRSRLAVASRRRLLAVATGALALPPLAAGADRRRQSQGDERVGAQAAGDRTLIGYYVGYERDLMPPAEIEWDTLTHIAVGVVLPKKYGTLDLGFDLGNEGQDFARDVAERAHDHGVVPILMIGGAGTHQAFKAAASGKRRKKFVRNLVAAMGTLGYDGLDLDWEPLQRADQQPFKALVSALRDALPDAVLTHPAGYTTLSSPDVPAVYAEVAPLLDRINIMTYSMEGAYPQWRSWHSSALDGATAHTPSSVATTVANYLDAGVPASKLGVGIGFFGDCWKAPVTGPSQEIGHSDIVATDGKMSYTTIIAEYFEPGAADVDPSAQVPYLGFDTPKGDKRCTYISYEDSASIAAKGQWALDHGLGGAIVWTINQGHDRSAPAGQRDALLRAARTAFGA